VCTSARDELVAAYPNVEARLTVIPNAVDTNRFHPNPETRQAVCNDLGLGQDERVALFVGSEWRGKGVDVIVMALALAPGWRLVVVGNGDEDALAHLARNAGVEHRVLCAGVRSDPERFMAAADAFVHPSDGETDSMTIMQAAASGLPVIATDVGAARERIGSRGEGGLIVERSAQAIAGALNDLARDPATAVRMGERNALVAQGWSWDAVADAYDHLYDAVAHGEGGS
jgi:UDP-glucose:(heptosyl)LPS alpha-1,3-glucosyltransferase